MGGFCLAGSGPNEKAAIAPSAANEAAASRTSLGPLAVPARGFRSPTRLESFSTRGGDAMRLLGRRAECEFLDTVLADALDGQSRVVVLRGDAGAGKSVLLDYVVERGCGWRIAAAVGIESETELAYGGLHQLCAPMLDHLDRLPAPQRSALATVFGLENGTAPDRFMVGLATLTLLAEVAEAQPLLCVVDDAHWLDDVSAQIILFVARRLLVERIAIVCVARSGIGDGVLTS